MVRDILDGWENLSKREQAKRRRALAKHFLKLLETCQSDSDCKAIAIKVAMLRIAFPNDCPDPLEYLGMQLFTSKDGRDFEFLMTVFPNLKASGAAEAQLATLKCPG